MENCSFCNITNADTHINLLEETKNFRIICDNYPIAEGHILIIPKEHISCVGQYTDELFAEFEKIYEKVSQFVLSSYGSVSTFEHGKIGQTVFHSHVHVFPFVGSPLDIIPEGQQYFKEVSSMSEVRGKTEYLFFSIDKNAWLVDIALGFPRFFRDKFAQALGNGERGDWKATKTNTALQEKFNAEAMKCQKLWQQNTTN